MESGLVLALIAVTIFGAGIVTGATALGFAQISAVVLALLLDARSAVIILAVIVPIISGLQIVHHRRAALPARRLLPVLAGALLGVPAGVWLLTVLPEQAIAGLVGATSLGYVATRFLRWVPTIRGDREPIVGPLAGIGGGILNGAIGLSGPILIPYLLALGLGPASFGYAVSVMYVAMTSVRLVGLVGTGALVPATALLGAVLLVPALVGQRLGFVLQQRLATATFERVALASLFVGGLTLVVRAFGL